jgi:hypothetical protein
MTEAEELLQRAATQLERIADALELIAEKLDAVVCTVNEGEPNEEHAIQVWKAGEDEGE